MRSIVALLSLPGCVFVVPQPPAPIDCTLEARSSVTVTVNDEAGEPLADAVVHYRVDGGPERPCENLGDTFVCGWEVPGAFEIRAGAPGYDEQTASVDVGMTSDGCHVLSQVLTLNLLPVCDDPPPAMLVTVLQPDGAPAVDETVSWGNAYTDGPPQPCSADAGSGVWACAYGVFGLLDLYVVPAASDPFASVLQQVPVGQGECGPETVELTVTFEYLPD